jgi:hypothetical protein
LKSTAGVVHSVQRPRGRIDGKESGPSAKQPIVLVTCGVENPAGIACAESISGFESSVATGRTVDHTWLLVEIENAAAAAIAGTAPTLILGNIDGNIVFDDPRRRHDVGPDTF